MYNLLVKLMLITVLLQLGWTFSKFESCHSRECLVRLGRHSRDILKIDWKPISVFPKEAARFYK